LESNNSTLSMELSSVMGTKGDQLCDSTIDRTYNEVE
jgi:hypothetical protein